MYSVGVVYNTFPTPPGFDTGSLDLSKLEPLAQAVLDARAAHPGATLAALYDPDLMPPVLRRSHQALDRGRGPPLQARRLRLGARARRAPVHAV